MKNARNNDFSDRRIAAAEAKSSLLNAYRTARSTDEPARLARQAERATIAAAKEKRRLERERVKRDDAERQAAEAAERQAAADAETRAKIEAREEAERNRIARVVEDEAARKAARDLRYANRKARRA
ncbi:DUF6481 family protein [Shinella sp. M31]|uniref:DUF6481 family protein n=1 Tax=Shinella sp. M31 TaxID=3368615 RepID=UPI0028D548C3|nr:DUF6481 family protein [uncultured Shinella sp.]